VAALNLYFVFAHVLAPVFCFWLRRDLGLSAAAAILGGLAFALGGFAGSVSWLQILHGVVWIPMVALFCLRSIRGRRPTASAALAGTFLGISFLSGRHQIPVLTALVASGFCCAKSRGIECAPGRRWRRLARSRFWRALCRFFRPMNMEAGDSFRGLAVWDLLEPKRAVHNPRAVSGRSHDIRRFRRRGGDRLRGASPRQKRPRVSSKAYHEKFA